MLGSPHLFGDVYFGEAVGPTMVGVVQPVDCMQLVQVTVDLIFVLLSLLQQLMAPLSVGLLTSCFRSPVLWIELTQLLIDEEDGLFKAFDFGFDLRYGFRTCLWRSVKLE